MIPKACRSQQPDGYAKPGQSSAYNQSLNTDVFNLLALFVMLCKLSAISHFIVAMQLLLLSLPVFAEEISFRKSIAPILLANCHGCHNETTAEGSYKVTSFSDMLTAGESEEQPVFDGDPGKSELLRRLTTDDPDERMPAESDALAASSIRLVKQWIEQGAKYDAESKNAPLASILPIVRHPDPPETYRRTLPVTALEFVGDELLIGGYHEVLRWSLKQQKLVQRIPQVGERIYRISVLHDSERIIVGSGSPGKLGEVRMLNAATGELVAVPLVTNEVVLDVALHPNEALLAAASADHKIHLIDLAEFRVTKSIDSHSDWVRAVTWNKDGTLLASASRDKTAKVFDVKTGRPIATYAGHAEDVVDVVFVDDQRLLTCDAVGKAHLWNRNQDKKSLDLPTKGTRAFQLLPTQYSVWLASNSSDVTEFTWEGEKELRSLGPHDAWVFSIAIDERNKRMATGDASGRVRVWDLEENQLQHEFLAKP